MANPGVAVPGSVVAIGSQVSPAGPQGIQGPSTISANANNKAALGTDSLILVQGTAAGVAATTHAQTVSGDDPQLTNARTPTAHQTSHVTGGDIIPNASTTANGLLKQVSGNATDFIDGTNNSQNLATAVQPTIWSVRLRSFQALGNNTFEVDQRTAGTGPSVANSFALDRWFYSKVGTMTFSVLAQQDASASPILLPGTSFALSQNFLRFTLGTQQSALGATDKAALYQYVEGPRLRELISDVHSLQVLVRSSVAGLSFGISLQDVASTRTLVKLATIPSSGTWTLIPLANLPVWPAGTTWSTKPGVQGYFLGICLAAGSTITAAANNTWQNANVVGALGQSNFAAQTVGSTFDIAYISHEPGAQASNPPIDCPWQQNYDDSLRYFCKSYNYAIKPGTSGNALGDLRATFIASQHPLLPVAFKKQLAKTPTVTGYSYNSGAANTVFDANAVTDKAITAAVDLGESGFNGFTVTSPNAGTWQGQFHYIADTGW
jgi:hypothetical protein